MFYVCKGCGGGNDAYDNRDDCDFVWCSGGYTGILRNRPFDQTGGTRGTTGQ